jgi:hypothetical protein
MTKNNKTNKKNLQEEIIKICLKIAKRGEGALIIVGENISYTPLVNQKILPFNIIEDPKTLESLSLMDGAVIINNRGFMIAYGVKIKATKVLKNFGTRHSAAYSASLIKNTKCFLVSEEESKVKIFKDGKIVMQIDALQKGIENKASDINHLLESIGFGTVGSLSVGVLLPTLGLAGLAISFLPGVLIFGTSYYILKKITILNKKSMNKK